MTEGLSVAAAAELTGLTADTLRYYDRQGLMLRPLTRTSSGHRRYGELDIAWVRLLTKLRSTGMPIRDVRRYADLVRAGDGNEEDRLELLLAHRQLVMTRLAEVQEHLSAIDDKIGLYRARVASPVLCSPAGPTTASCRPSREFAVPAKAGERRRLSLRVKERTR
jgi:DNA-binding transcriptional MerR regulator